MPQINPTNWLFLSNLGIILFTSLYIASFSNINSSISINIASNKSNTILWSW